MILGLLLSLFLQFPLLAQEDTSSTSQDESNISFEALLKDGRERLTELYETNVQWLKDKKQTQERYLKIANGVLKIISDKEIQKSAQELIERFKFKPLLITEVLFLLLTLVFRASRPPGRGFFARILEHLLISLIYLIGAFIVIPTLFLGTNFLYLAWTLTQRLLVLFQSATGPVG